MTRLFALLPLVAGVLADVGGGPNNKDPKSGGGNGNDEIDINLGPVQIKIVGSFNGLGKWVWQGAKPAANATIHQVR
jgi:hypothetical protein